MAPDNTERHRRTTTNDRWYICLYFSSLFSVFMVMMWWVERAECFIVNMFVKWGYLWRWQRQRLKFPGSECSEGSFNIYLFNKFLNLPSFVYISTCIVICITYMYIKTIYFKFLISFCNLLLLSKFTSMRQWAIFVIILSLCTYITVSMNVIACTRMRSNRQLVLMIMIIRLITISYCVWLILFRSFRLAFKHFQFNCLSLYVVV